MKQLDPFTISEAATLLDAVERIEKNKSRAVIVVQGDTVTGVISEGDIMRALLQGVEIRTPLSQFIHRSFKFLNKRDLKLAFGFFKKHGISLVPVVDDGFKLLDVITVNELLKDIELP